MRDRVVQRVVDLVAERGRRVFVLRGHVSCRTTHCNSIYGGCGCGLSLCHLFRPSLFPDRLRVPDHSLVNRLILLQGSLLEVLIWGGLAIVRGAHVRR